MIYKALTLETCDELRFRIDTARESGFMALERILFLVINKNSEYQVGVVNKPFALNEKYARRRMTSRPEY